MIYKCWTSSRVLGASAPYSTWLMGILLHLSLDFNNKLNIYYILYIDLTIFLMLIGSHEINQKLSWSWDTFKAQWSNLQTRWLSKGYKKYWGKKTSYRNHDQEIKKLFKREFPNAMIKLWTYLLPSHDVTIYI